MGPFQVLLFVSILGIGQCGNISDEIPLNMLVRLDISNVGKLVHVSRRTEPPITRTIYYLKDNSRFISVAESGTIIWEVHGGEMGVDVVLYSKGGVPLMITLLVENSAEFKYVYFEKVETWKQISKETYVSKLVEFRTS